MPRLAQPIPRLLAARVRTALEDTPVVLIHGARQSGKTTLARMVGEPLGFKYLSFDDAATLDFAQEDPVGFVDGLPERVILDEVQRAPRMFMSLKASVDMNRIPGRFILTGSANVMVVPKLSDSLAGRIGILRLYPFSQCELEGQPPRFLDALLTGQFCPRVVERLGPELADRIVTGGYPVAVARREPERRAAWYRDYVDSEVQQDVLDLSRIRSLDTLPRLLEVASGRTAQLLNVSQLSAPFELDRETIHSHIVLLENVFLLQRLQPWFTNRLSRLVKRPKLHMADTGVACALLGVEAADMQGDRILYGSLLETFVLQELQRQAGAREDRLAFYHFRDRDGHEVDIVIERGVRAVAGVEVKAAGTVNEADFRGLRKLREAAGDRFVHGVVLYDGTATIPFGDRLHAVPVRSLWETP